MKHNRKSALGVGPSLVLLGALLAGEPALAACLGMQIHSHRGNGLAPENSLQALGAAYQGGFDGVETDLQMLGDREWVVHHDQATGRVVRTAAPVPVNSLRSADWRAARMTLRGAVTDDAPPFASDLASLASTYPQATLNAEIKTVAACQDIGALVRQLQGEVAHGNWFLTSPLEANLRCARQADREGYLGLVVLDPRNAQALGNSRATRFIASRARAPRLDRNWLNGLQQRIGAPVGVHVDARTLDANAKLLVDATALSMPVFVYAVDGDSALAAALQRARRATGLWPSGAIVDGSAEAFCSKLR
jgi:glycerophosphoryl diester phosphodiesterase